MNYQDLLKIAQTTLMALHNGEVSGSEKKEEINAIGKITNIYKLKLEYVLNKHKINETVDFLEDY